MLTRIEIDGFKSFEGFELDLEPFTVIFGGNAVGKSNLFDALRLLSRIVTHDLSTAFSSDERALGDELRGEPIEQFRKLPGGEVAKQISIGVELLLAPTVQDAWGEVMSLSQTRLRYEITVERRDESGHDKLFVVREEALPIRKDEDCWLVAKDKAFRAFQKHVLKYGRKSKFLSTSQEDHRPLIEIHQDKKQGRKRPGNAAEAAVLSSIATSAEFPHLYALREELRSIHFVQLDPTALRAPSPAMEQDTLRPDGRNLARVLARIEQETKTENRPRGVLNDILSDLRAIVPSVRDLRVVEDKEERRYRLELMTQDGLWLSSRIISDGTSRLLALTTMLNDPRRRGVVCFEEPENGVHKSRLTELVDLLRRSCTDPASDDPTLLQVIINTHSPVVANALVGHRQSIVVADILEVIEKNSASPRRKTRMRRLATSLQEPLPLDTAVKVLTPGEIEQLADLRDPSAA